MKILYSDDAITVIEKDTKSVCEDVPGGIPQQIRLHTGQTYVGVVHRLDAGTGGVMVYANTEKATAALSKQLTEGRLNKMYIAVLHGIPEQQEDTWTDYLYHDKNKNKTFVVKKDRHGVKKAVLSYRITDTKQDFSLLRIQLKTGRTHQIRIQCASRKHPLYGDRKYGAPETGTPALWSAELSFIHPVSGKEMCFHSPVPDTPPWNLFG